MREPKLTLVEGRRWTCNLFHGLAVLSLIVYWLFDRSQAAFFVANSLTSAALVSVWILIISAKDADDSGAGCVASLVAMLGLAHFGAFIEPAEGTPATKPLFWMVCNALGAFTLITAMWYFAKLESQQSKS